MVIVLCFYTFQSSLFPMQFAVLCLKHTWKITLWNWKSEFIIFTQTCLLCLTFLSAFEYPRIEIPVAQQNFVASLIYFQSTLFFLKRIVIFTSDLSGVWVFLNTFHHNLFCISQLTYLVKPQSFRNCSISFSLSYNFKRRTKEEITFLKCTFLWVSMFLSM